MTVILVGSNRETGRLIEVGLYENAEAARPYVAKNGGHDVVYSLWTPGMNETMEMPSAVGFSLPPKRSHR